jgi:hypothetical protein
MPAPPERSGAAQPMRKEEGKVYIVNLTDKAGRDCHKRFTILADAERFYAEQTEYWMRKALHKDGEDIAIKADDIR